MRARAQHLRPRRAVRGRDRVRRAARPARSSASASSTASPSPPSITVLTVVPPRSRCCPRFLGFFGMKVLTAEGAPPARDRGSARPEARRAAGRSGRRFVQRRPVPLALVALLVMLLLADPDPRRCGSAPPTPARTRRSIDDAQGLRPARQGLRPRLQRPAPDRRRRRPSGKADLPKLARAREGAASTAGRRRRSARPCRRPNGEDRADRASSRPRRRRTAQTSDLINDLRDDVIPQRARHGAATSTSAASRRSSTTSPAC